MTLTDDKIEHRRALTRARVARHRAAKKSGAIKLVDTANWSPDPERDTWPMLMLQKRDGRWELSQFGEGMSLAWLLEKAGIPQFDG